MKSNLSQREKAKRFHELHHSRDLLILPNIWDPLGAILLESLGYPAVATASAAIAFSNGYDDGENISLGNLLSILKRITSLVNIPVTADVESGYADSDAELKTNMRQLIEAGITGINLEDTDKKTKTLLSIEDQCKRISLAREAAEEMDVPLFINARTDVYIPGKDYVPEARKFDEMIARGLAYKSAGADCFYPIAMQNEAEIRETVKRLDLPINVLTIPGVPELKVLHEIGVARVSLGPSFLKIAIKAMKELAAKLQNLEGLPDIIQNDITSAYLKQLVNKDY